MFEPDISVNKVNFKNEDFKGVNLEIDLNIKNNFFIDVELNNIYISLFKDKLGSGNKVGEANLKECYTLHSNQSRTIKLDVKIYYLGIIINAIPVLLKKGFSCILDIDVYFKILFFRGHKNIIRKEFLSVL